MYGCCGNGTVPSNQKLKQLFEEKERERENNPYTIKKSYGSCLPLDLFMYVQK